MLAAAVSSGDRRLIRLRQKVAELRSAVNDRLKEVEAAQQDKYGLKIIILIICVVKKQNFHTASLQKSKVESEKSAWRLCSDGLCHPANCMWDMVLCGGSGPHLKSTRVIGPTLVPDPQ